MSRPGMSRGVENCRGTLQESPRVGPPAPPGEASMAEVALAAWVGVALLGILGGLGIAKYSQAWARSIAHPAAILGGLLILASVGVALVACARYFDRTVPLPRSRSRALVVLSLLLVIGTGWAALSIVAFAGWEWPVAAR